MTGFGTPQPSRLCAECPIDGVTFCRIGASAAVPGIRPGFSMVRRGRPIYRQGDVGSEVHLLRDGVAFRTTILPDGRRQILEFALRGDPILLPLLFVPRLPYGVYALTDTVLCTFAVNEVAALTRTSPAFARRLEAACVDALMRAETRLADINQRSARERAAWLLMSLYRDLRERGLSRDDGTVPFPLRLSHIADALGLTVTHASRTLGALRREGVISLSDGRLTVHRLRELAAIAALPGDPV